MTMFGTTIDSSALASVTGGMPAPAPGSCAEFANKQATAGMRYLARHGTYYSTALVAALKNANAQVCNSWGLLR